VPSSTSIEWTDVTWNPVTGCTKVSAGCRNCYAERMARRLQAMGQPRYRDGFRVAMHREVISAPSRWRRPRMVFVNSMSDLFHEAVPEEFIAEVFATMAAYPQHVFQVLTKRSERLAAVAAALPWPENVWMGVTVEDRGAVRRIADLQQVPARIRFLSCEPLLGPLGAFPLRGIHWVIAGGESGPGARPMAPEWVEAILTRCRAHDVPFFLKQWGGVHKKRNGRLLHGRTYDEFPRGALADPMIPAASGVPAA